MIAVPEHTWVSEASRHDASGQDTSGQDASGRDAAFCYDLFGLRIASELELPELAPCGVSNDRPAEIVIRRGGVPPTDGFFTADEDTASLTIDQVARYRVRRGSEITVDAFPQASEKSLRLFLLGSALGVICHQRGLLPLHANAVVTAHGAIAIAGDPGAGKSTLAAYFQSRGFDILCDDVCALSFASDGEVMAWPGLPYIKLWRDALERFGHDPRGLTRILEGQDKFHLPLARKQKEPRKLVAIYVLRPRIAGSVGAIRRLSGARALRAVLDNTYRGAYLPAMERSAPHFSRAVALAGRVPLYEVSRAETYEPVAVEASRLEDHWSRSADATDASPSVLDPPIASAKS